MSAARRNVQADPDVAGPRPGAVGVCKRCGRWVLRRNVDEAGLHNAVLVYGRRRRACGGEVVPLWRGSTGR
ncbi:MAG: hypothetical protein IVW52_04900 [Acidimicrobiales bacterium]|nr:hypothetical protein [Acidimicrobiales bacterium]